MPFRPRASATGCGRGSGAPGCVSSGGRSRTDRRRRRRRSSSPPPHTSNWDLPFTLATAWALGLRVRWLGKASLFRWPFGWAMRQLGGIAVDRSRRTDAVKTIARLFREYDGLLLVIPPEGTRGVAGRWKSGFYWIAVEAGVPILLGSLDFARRRASLGEVLHPTGDLVRDFARVRSVYADVRGRHPERQGTITLDDPPRA